VGNKVKQERVSPERSLMLEALNGTHLPRTDSKETSAHGEDLVARAKLDRQAFAALYDLYLLPIYRYCFKRLGSKEAAEDATSLIFAKAIDNLATCRNDRFRSWLFAIAHNVVADVHRSDRNAVPLDAAKDVSASSPSPDDIASQNDEAGLVQRLIARLTSDQRDVVELRMAGLSGPEIARALGRSHGAVRIAQFRAYSRLRDLYREQCSSPAEGPDHEE
jgi:RNA polymerase sigma-70 factor (ECF subfamily)